MVDEYVETAGTTQNLDLDVCGVKRNIAARQRRQQEPIQCVSQLLAFAFDSNGGVECADTEDMAAGFHDYKTNRGQRKMAASWAANLHIACLSPPHNPVMERHLADPGKGHQKNIYLLIATCTYRPGMHVENQLPLERTFVILGNIGTRPAEVLINRTRLLRMGLLFTNSERHHQRKRDCAQPGEHLAASGLEARA